MMVQDLPISEWTILYYFYTISATSKPTILHCTFFLPRTQPVSLSEVCYRLGKLQMSVCPHNLQLMFGF